MARDLFLGETNTTWSRGESTSGEQPLQLTPKEKDRIEKLAVLEMQSSQGNVEAQKKLVQINVALGALQKKAARGDASATRLLDTLKESGLVQRIASSSRKSEAKLTMAGISCSGFNGHTQFIRGLSDEVDFTFTEDEKCMLEKLTITRTKAEQGDKTARQQLARFANDLTVLRAKAKKGDAKAKRTLLVLVESGAFNPTQKLDISGSMFKDDPHSKDRRAERYETEIRQITTPNQIEDQAKVIAFNPEYKQYTLNLASKGNTTARKILDASEKYAAGTTSHTSLPKLVRGKVVESSGDSNNTMERLRVTLRQLNKKTPKTDDDLRAIESLTERLTRLEAMSGESGAFVGRETRGQRRARRQQRLTSLKTRAAAGDQTAVARLQRIQAKLSTELSDLSTPSTTISPAVNPYGAAPYGTPPLSPSYRPTNPVTTPPIYPTAYPPAYPTYQQPYAAYQSPYYDESLSQNPYGPLPQPTIDVYQGDEEAAALAGDGGSAERAALRRTGRMDGTFIGLAIPNSTYRATIQKYARRKAGGDKPTTKDIFLAKAAVDQAIGKAGITLYLPGAQPGRRTI